MSADDFFSWDEAKASVNLKKHGVSFYEAGTVFGDPAALSFYDEAHSDSEIRWITIGRSERGRILIVVTAELGDAVRIISARDATRKERDRYVREE